ncbi:MAG: patatin-like phospholipase family protein [Bacteroidota bacterium]
MPKLTKILSIDGGGIRGIIPGQVLVALEKKLQEKSKNPGARIADHFDLLAGTSTGGILTCIYLCPDEKKPSMPRFSAQEAVNLYLEKGGKIFDVSWLQKIRSVGGLKDEKFSARELEKALKGYFGKLRLSELLKPCLITSYEISKRYTYFFTQQDARKSKGYNFLVRDVARATSAAPTYFEAAGIRSFANKFFPLVDGGVFANNPALCAYSEARNLFKKPGGNKYVTAKDMVIVSLGTGQVKKPYPYNEAKDWGMVEWIKPVIDIMMSGVSETVDYQLKQIYDAVGCPGQYIRITPGSLGRANPDMDDASDENLRALKKVGNDTAKKYDGELDRVVDLLVK